MRGMYRNVTPVPMSNHKRGGSTHLNYAVEIITFVFKTCVASPWNFYIGLSFREMISADNIYLHFL